MASTLLFAAGQCGNQLAYEVLSSVFAQQFSSPLPLPASTSPEHLAAHSAAQDAREKLLHQLFRTDRRAERLARMNVGDPSYDELLSLVTARIVCLDTEPKVIEACLNQSRQHISRAKKARSQDNPASGPLSWRYDTSRLLYRHGGAGNNWALGYSMADSADFMERSMNAFRAEIELCDRSPHIVCLHSAAGGTGSGLGTRMTQALADEFPECCRSNIIIAPHHFGEVVVQHYNAVLTLATLADVSDSVVLFENETAHALCRDMHGMERPRLADLNQVLAQNLLPLFMPRYGERVCITGMTKSNGGNLSTTWADWLPFLCPLPGYKFLNLRLTPQTSRASVAYTYDSWSGMLKTIQRLQLSGSHIERHIRRDIKSLGLQDVSDTVSVAGSPPPSSVSQARSPQSPTAASAPIETVRSMASIITCHGDDSQLPVQQLGSTPYAEGSRAETLLRSNASNSGKRLLSNRVMSGSVVTPAPLPKPAPKTIKSEVISPDTLFDAYNESHNDLHQHQLSRASPIHLLSSPLRLNGYARAVTVLSNDQSILPYLHRSLDKAGMLFRQGAYLHQYASYGLEHDDFVSAFRTLGGVVRNYQSL